MPDLKEFRALDRENLSEILASQDAFGSVILSCAELLLGAEALWGDEDTPEWPTSLIFNELEAALGIKLLEQSENRFNALRTAIQTDAFYQEPDACKIIAMSLSGGDVGDITDLLADTPTLAELAWAEHEISLWRDPVPNNTLVDAVWQQASQLEAQENPQDQGLAEQFMDFARQLKFVGLV